MKSSGFWLIPFAVGPYVALAFTQEPVASPSFAKDVMPIIRAHCISCHSEKNASGGLDLESEAGWQKGGVSGALFKGNKPDETLFMSRVLGKGALPQMPMGFAPLNAAQLKVLRDWIGQGAKRSGDGDFAAVQAILKAHCYSCHSGENLSAGLDLAKPETWKGKGIITPGDPVKSKLVRRVRGLDGMEQMPKGFAPLSDAQISQIERWVRAGASTQVRKTSHWAYVAPVRPNVPIGYANPIDAFVRNGLKRKGMAPAARADRETLLRRVSLDLTGLPPTLDEMNAFLADRSPRAYDKVVERLLASPHYGERQARPWLDLARYADTNGYEADRTREAWVFRDWVIEAFNANMPFDKFTIEQLAGDLLPSPKQDQLIATGFHRNSMFNEEGGVDPNESMYETVLDRVNTTSTVWLGSTLACSRCHDHKFDPFTAKDYFQMYAFFGNNEYEVRGDNNVGQQRFFEPTISIFSANQAILDRNLRELKARHQRTVSAAKGFGEWRERIKTDPFMAVPIQVRAESGMALNALSDGSWKAEGKAPGRDRYYVDLNLPEGKWTGLRLESMPDKSLVNGGSGLSSSGNFILSDVRMAGAVLDAEADFVQANYSLRGLFDANGETGWALSPQQSNPHHLVVAWQTPVVGPRKLTVELGFQSGQWPQHLLGRFRVKVTQAPSPIQFVADASASEGALRARYARVGPESRASALALEVAEAEIAALTASAPRAMILRDRKVPGPLRANVHTRGEFLSKGESVTAGVPHFLPQPTPGQRADRLTLAKWLVNPQNPLTARVTVNRIWALYFGRGLVPSEDDFGTQGDRPTQPELLDWMATEFVRSGWDMKHIHRLIVTSETYKQSSHGSRASDPNNDLYARGPRFRMEAEMIRDNALTASGLLNRKQGGPSVMPYQPPGIWDGPYSGERWMAANGNERFRRGLYIFYKRTAPYPTFSALDAPSREQCTVQRSKTNTPLQALALLNDPAYLEAAKGLAARLSVKTGEEAKAILAFRLATGRTPSKKEVAPLVKLAHMTRARYRKDVNSAVKLAGDPEFATWVVVANVILNLDETLNKG